MVRIHALALWMLTLFGCLRGDAVDVDSSGAKPEDPATMISTGPVRTGAQVLSAEGFRRLAGKRVGLIVNHTAMVDSVHLADLMSRTPGVKLTALFGPEHGIRGQAAAGEEVAGGRDVRTGVPIYSLYGKTNKPTAAMLRDVDVLVFDIQDVGARFFTYISTMGLAMQAAAEKGIPFVVLDRPNPLGGEYVSGFVMEPANESFVGMYPIPIAHGLTVGELARMIQGERMLPGLERLDLQVVPMAGWRRSMLWPETGLPWIPPSPNVPNFETALVYPGAAFFEATSASEGRGTRAPFKQLGAPGADGAALAAALNTRKLPGVAFEPATFTPEDLPGMAVDPKQEGKTLLGVRYRITNIRAFDPVAAGVYVLQAFYEATPPAQRAAFLDRPEWLAKLSGTSRFAELLRRGVDAGEIVAAWKDEVDAFRRLREEYLLYK